ncbi:lipoyl(octanoyl) transferase [Phytophthora nicotianae CJ01A1]|uniref:lipoyl(octanoyl) transferase n=2 Tax=Phytophthora nicotianae TaxID=4792 RepID=W2WIK1_PHYNI|nr:lipoyl(octanoyl) transferase [Phytophthora nicotianae]ETP10400.1 lipoyl(octanoyl) transferase [Phytophthora nicotianae CJ01A1]
MIGMRNGWKSALATALSITRHQRCLPTGATLARFLSTEAAALETPQLQRKCVAYRLGSVEYETAWDWQKQLIQQRVLAIRAGQSVEKDVVLILEHPDVYTLGRGGTMENVKFDPEKEHVKLVRVDRGGEVTYHGPGQVVVYPILDLTQHKKDLHWYLRQVEEVVIRTLAKLDIQGERVDGLTGVWVEEKQGYEDGEHRKGNYEREMRKICAVGTHASRWVTMHGFALNVTTDLRGFDRIIPCGIDDRAVTSIERIRPDATIKDVQDAASEAISEVFHLDMEDVEAKTPL